MMCLTCDVVTRQPGHCDERARPVTASLWAERVHTGLESFLSINDNIVMMIMRVMTYLRSTQTT